MLFFITTCRLLGQQTLPHTDKMIDLSLLDWAYSTDSIGVSSKTITAYKDEYHRGHFLHIPQSDSAYSLTLKFRIGTKTFLDNHSLLIKNFAGSLDIYLNQIPIGKIEDKIYMAVIPIHLQLPLLFPDSIYSLRLSFRPHSTTLDEDILRTLNSGIRIELKNENTVDWFSLDYLLSDVRLILLVLILSVIHSVFLLTIIFQASMQMRWLLYITVGFFLTLAIVGQINLNQRTSFSYHIVKENLFILTILLKLTSDYVVFSLGKVSSRDNFLVIIVQLGLLLANIIAIFFNTYASHLFYALLCVDMLSSIWLALKYRKANNADNYNRKTYILACNVFYWVHSYIMIYFAVNDIIHINIAPYFWIIYFIVKSVNVCYVLFPYFKLNGNARLRWCIALILLLFSFLLIDVESSKFLISLFALNFFIDLPMIFYHSRSVNRELLAKQLRLLNLEKEKSQTLEIEVQRRTLQLREAVKNREDLLQIIAHDFRGQVVSIHNFLHLLAAKGTQWLANEQSGFINSQIRHVHALQLSIDNTLMWSISQKGALTPSVSVVNISSLVSILLQQHERDAQLKKISFDHHIQTHVEHSIDEMHLTLAVRNLLSNSLKYAPKGSCIRIDLTDDLLRITNEPSKDNREMRGTGIGLPTTEALLTKNNCRFNIVFNPKVEATIFFTEPKFP